MKSSPPDSIYVTYLKPIIDIMLALLIILPVFPFFLMISAALLIVNKGKIFFRQERIGLHERVFIALKFKTMNDAVDRYGNLLPDEKRITLAGRFVRKTSLDEIPQIINVLKGDMSFIGPRPLLPEYLPYYDDIQKQRHLVKPGITGLAQVNGRNLTTWEKRFEMDVHYVQNISFWLDIKIFFKTIVKVLKSEGISAEGHATMPKFSDYVKAKSPK